MRGNAGARGFTLLLVSGLLTGLVLLAALFVQTARLVRLQGNARLDGVQAGLSAESGMDYAAARLWQSTDRFFGAPRIGDPGWASGARTATLANRADDWQYRAYDRDDGTWLADKQGPIPVEWLDPPLETVPEISYARGEPWRDLNGNSLCDPDQGETFVDADRNGRPDAWSGRLRSGRPSAGRFRLKVEPGAGSRIPLNVHSTLKKEHEIVLNNLGAVLGVRRYAVGVAYDPAVRIWWSDLGTFLALAAPAKGWKDVRQLEPVLGTSDYRRVRRFLSAAPPVTWEGTGFPNGYSVEPYLDLESAPRRILEASLRYRQANTLADGILRSQDFPDCNQDGEFDGDDIGGIDPDTRLAAYLYPHVSIIHPGEANAAARGIDAVRRDWGWIPSWGEMFRSLHAQKGVLFPAYMTNPVDSSFPYFTETIQNRKVDIAFGTLLKERTAPASLPTGVSVYDVDGYVSGDPDSYPGRGRQYGEFTTGSFPVVQIPEGQTYTDFKPFDGAVGGPSAQEFLLCRWTLGSPLVFDIRSVEGSGGAARGGSMRVGERLWVMGQEAFANSIACPPPWGPGKMRLLPRGIRVEGEPAWPIDPDSGSRAVVTLDVHPLDVFDPMTFGYDAGETSGGVALARRVRAGWPGAGPAPILTTPLPYVTLAKPAPDADLDRECHLDLGGAAVAPADPTTKKWVSAIDVAKLLEVCGPYLMDKWNYLFRQYPHAGDPEDPDFPRLDLDALSAEVPAAYLGFGYLPGDFRAVRRLGVSFTANKHGSFRLDNMPPTNGTWSFVMGCFTRLEIKMIDGVWTVSFMNGPLTDGMGTHWNPNAIFTLDDAVRQAHTRTFTGEYRQGTDAAGDATYSYPGMNGFYRVTLVYWTRKIIDDFQYPPDYGRLVLWVTHPSGGTQKVIDEALAWTPETAGVPGMPQAEMFYLAKSTNDHQGKDSRRTHVLSVANCADLSVFDPVEGSDNRDQHDRHLSEDFLCRKGVWESPLYVLPEPTELSRISWEGIIPRDLWDACGKDALRLTVLLHPCPPASGAPVELPLECVLADAGTLRAHALPVPGAAPSGAGIRFATFRFRAAFDCTAWPEPLAATPVLGDLSLEFRTRPVWNRSGSDGSVAVGGWLRTYGGGSAQ